MAVSKQIKQIIWFFSLSVSEMLNCDVRKLKFSNGCLSVYHWWCLNNVLHFCFFVWTSLSPDCLDEIYRCFANKKNFSMSSIGEPMIHNFFKSVFFSPRLLEMEKKQRGRFSITCWMVLDHFSGLDLLTSTHLPADHACNQSDVIVQKCQDLS